MWICPKCKREFKNINQGHYCGKAPETVDEYVESQLPDIQAHIIELINIIRHYVPQIKERIAWSMPRYEKDGRSVSFAACKDCISFYAGEEVLKKIETKTEGFGVRKNAIYFPYGIDLPKEVIEDILKQCFETEE